MAGPVEALAPLEAVAGVDAPVPAGAWVQGEAPVPAEPLEAAASAEAEDAPQKAKTRTAPGRPATPLRWNAASSTQAIAESVKPA